ncbi:cytochrome c biogenesis CcdA family protein [Paractinoplanes tereljensis]
MLGAVNPCGFALLPAYLSVLLVQGPASPGNAVWRALRCTLALTLGYVLVFGTFGLVLTPLAGELQPRLPWLTVVLGLVLAGLGVWLTLGRSLPTWGVRAPALTGSTWSMVVFGMAYAIASLGCAVGPFLALVASSLRASTLLSGVGLFLAYAAGMGLVVGVTAVAVALLRSSLITRTRRLLGLVPRIGGAILVVSGLYVAYYGWYELRLARNLRLAGHDPIVAAASRIQQWLAGWISVLGAVPLAVVLVILLLLVVVRRRARALPPDGPSGVRTGPAAAGPTSPLRAEPGLRRRAGTR